MASCQILANKLLLSSLSAFLYTIFSPYPSFFLSMFLAFFFLFLRIFLSSFLSSVSFCLSLFSAHLEDEKHSLLQKPYNMVDYQVEDGVQLWHLVSYQFIYILHEHLWFRFCLVRVECIVRKSCIKRYVFYLKCPANLKLTAKKGNIIFYPYLFNNFLN